LNDLRTEEEQLAAIKGWWSDHGTQLLAGIAIVAIGYFGYQSWQNKKEQEAFAAGDIYAQLQDAVVAASGSQGSLTEFDLEQIRTIGYLADQLQEEHATNGYALLGALGAARAAADRDDYAEAITRLEWALQAEQDVAGKQLITYRLAIATAAIGADQEALVLLTGADDSFAAIYAEARGDIYRSMGDVDSAAAEYEAAVDLLLDEQLSYAPTLEFKLADVAAGLAALSANNQ
jgi:predicted negative regulator of RcsB-dependent stress response